MDIVGMDEAAVRRELGERCGVIALEDREREDLERHGRLMWQQSGMEEGGKNEKDQTEVVSVDQKMCDLFCFPLIVAFISIIRNLQRKIINSGAPGNRIDVVLMGDGKKFLNSPQCVFIVI